MNRPIGLWIVFAVAAYLAFLVLHAYWEYLFFATLFAILCAPLSERLQRKIGPTFAALATTLGVVLLVVLPTIYIVATTVAQAPSAYQSVLTAFDKENVQSLLGVTGEQARTFATSLGDKLRQNVLTNVTQYLNQLSDIIIGLVIMFMTMFFLIRDGRRIVAYLLRTAPVRRSYADRFLREMRSMIHGVVVGQLVTALVQGALVGLLFLVLGLDNPLFWGVVATILSIIPVLGPLIVYIPASVFLFLQDRYVAGGFMLLFGIVVISQIDNVIRPYVTARSAHVHPLIPLLGAIGGIKLWGMVGFIVGPLALAAALVLADFVLAESHESAKS